MQFYLILRGKKKRQVLNGRIEKLPCERAEDTSGQIEVKHHCQRTISTQLNRFYDP